MRRSPRFSREIREIGFFNMQTLKLLTTSKRYHRLEKDLDINAGRLLEGVSLEQLVQESVEQVIRVAEGRRTFGERAEHSQAGRKERD